MQANGTRLYRVKAVAEMFDVSVSTIYRAIESGALVALKLGTSKGTLRIPESALTAFEDACSVAAARARTSVHAAATSDNAVSGGAA
jgi:excisionase family DNA binding protein